MDNLKVVKAAPGTKCPHEHFPREYIIDSVPVNVPNTAYYRRRIEDGSLIIQEAAAPMAAASIQEKKKGARK
jgi:hypothetical protein